MEQPKLTGIIAWFARNPVAANLLMLSIFFVGFFSYTSINKKMFPEINPNKISISVSHLGASPEEVEQAVILKIEEVVENIEGIKTVTSTAFEGFAQVELELLSGYSLSEKLDEVQMQVNTITTFPSQTERAKVVKVEVQGDVMWLAVYGSMDRKNRQELAKVVRDEILALPEVNLVEIVGNRSYEISVEISEFQLKKYSLTFDEISSAIKRSSIDLPGGAIKTDSGDVLLRTKGQVYRGAEYANLVLRTNPDGTRLLLKDVANIVDGFVEDEGYAQFNGEATTNIRVKSSGDQNDLAIAAAVKTYIKEKQKSLPEGVKLDIWADVSFYLNARLDMMIGNMIVGALLVFVVLALFLRIKIAFWVMMGIPVCFLGAFIIMPLLGDWSVSINMLSLFAFIMVLGIVVDDAIVIGESVYSEIRENGHSTNQVIRGAQRVSIPATFGVLTTIAAFTPLLMIESNFSSFFRAIAIVVTACLTFSLIESKWILPAHLAHMKYKPIDKNKANFIEKIQMKFRIWLDQIIKNHYQPLVTKAILYRYNTLAIFLAIFFVSIGLITSGLVKNEMFPNIPSDFIRGHLSMQNGTSIKDRNAALTKIIDAANALGEERIQENGKSVIKHTMAYTISETSGGFLIELTKPEERELGAFEIEKLWREKVGEIAGVKHVRLYAGTNARGGAALQFQFVGEDILELDLAAKELEKQLTRFKGVFDIRNSFNIGSQEIQLKIKPEAEILGLTLSDLGRQVRQAFYGEEAQRIQRGRDELKVMIRFPQAERRTLSDLENMWIRTPKGDQIPFYQVADIEIGTGFSRIIRVNKNRSVTVSADIDPKLVESEKIFNEINNNIIETILDHYPSVKYGIEGSAKDEKDLKKQFSLAALAALAMIYCLIAIPTHSYGQPLIIMSVIPFGIIGAIAGHWLFGMSLTMLSLYGIIALSGVVVNDSLIMADFINKARKQGLKITDAVIQSGTKRFRAILLTSLTTFFGVLPIYFETSLQAQFIIPMAISIGFGIVFATLITLFLIPCLYIILEDTKLVFKNLFTNIKLILLKKDHH